MVSPNIKSTITLLITSAFLAASDACPPCSCTGGSVNCSYRHLQQVPNNLPPGALSLDLSHNLLHYLPDNVFQRLTNLTVLDLSYNCLTNLTPSVFVGLCSLQWLSLSWNNISLSDENYPEGVFLPSAKSLFYLHVNGNGVPNENCTHITYPDRALEKLYKLRALFIDGLRGKQFGSGIGKLQSLRNLSIVGSENGFCDLVTLHNDTFTHHPPALQYLNLSYCNIRFIEADAFRPLRTLQILDLSHNEHLGFQRLGLAVYGLQGSSLHTLHINYINPHYAVCVAVKQTDTTYFKNTSITTIYARHNSLQYFFPGALLNMPDSLEVVWLQGNHLGFGSYFQDFKHLKHLKRIRADGYTQIKRTPTYYPREEAEKEKNMDNHDPFSDDKFSFCGTQPPDWSNPYYWSAVSDGGESQQAIKYKVTGAITPDTKYFVLPPNLTDFRSRQNQIYYKLTQINIDPNNELTRLDVSENLLVVLIGPVIGLNNLQHLDLGDNLAYHISETFFHNFSSLKTLSLNRNFLTSVISSSPGLFSSLVNLEELDLSDSYISTLPGTLLTGLVQLKTLNLSYNEIYLFDVDISSLGSLRLLDLAFNNIRSLPFHIRHHLDSVVRRTSENVTVNLTFNHISCTCANIDFLSWMAKTKVHFPKEGVYSCLMANGKIVRWINIFDIIADLEKKCSDLVGILTGAVSCCLCLVLALVSALVYRFRWKLRYLYYASRMSYRRTQSEHRQFLFDAFVSYASEDEDFVHGQLVPRLEQQEPLRLHVHSRDFTPGKPIACNIVAAVQNSRRTLVVLTRRLLQSDWCQYEMQMAIMEAVHTGRDVLLFLLYEDIPSQDIPRQVLYNLQSSTYIQFPHDHPERVPNFWSRLANALKD